MEFFTNLFWNRVYGKQLKAQGVSSCILGGHLFSCTALWEKPVRSGHRQRVSPFPIFQSLCFWPVIRIMLSMPVSGCQAYGFPLTIYDLSVKSCWSWALRMGGKMFPNRLGWRHPGEILLFLLDWWGSIRIPLNRFWQILACTEESKQHKLRTEISDKKRGCYGTTSS